MRKVVLALLCTAVLSLPAHAQANPQTRQGFWIAFGFGAGSLDCEDCGSEWDSQSGLSFDLRMGGTLSQKLLIGGEITGWTKTEGDVTATVGNIGPVLMFYPSANGGFFLKGGLGLATASVDFGSVTYDEQGTGITLGLGYDARVGRGFALTPYLDLVSTNFDNAKFTQVAFGLGFTWP